MAKITCGVNAAENASFNGMTITQVMEQYGQFFNIPNDNLVVLVNDEEVSNMSYIICSDDDVEFVKSAGEKGAARQASAPLKSLKDIRKENVKRRNCRLAVRRPVQVVFQTLRTSSLRKHESNRQTRVVYGVIPVRGHLWRLFMIDEKCKENYSHEKFWKKLRRNLKRISASALRQILTLYILLRSKHVPTIAKASIVAALGYLICPFDLIPDYIPSGLVDDLAAITILLAELDMYVTDQVKTAVDEMMKEYNINDQPLRGVRSLLQCKVYTFSPCKGFACIVFNGYSQNHV
eukprot:TRINITY_DN1786_c0_g1_i18.p1 TRINITY_DN1786_c0_g1~~TRINITY_DN1786_c0_g1_i18.p1  ORF type:complete len:292 (-),score=14.91 TRINITY_DN1786_c0_g1_i18:495-1370(-)